MANDDDLHVYSCDGKGVPNPLMRASAASKRTDEHERLKSGWLAETNVGKNSQKHQLALMASN
jgi:hypothetical protein